MADRQVSWRTQVSLKLAGSQRMKVAPADVLTIEMGFSIYQIHVSSQHPEVLLGGFQMLYRKTNHKKCWII